MSTDIDHTVLPPRWHARLAHQLEQLHLVRASLLPGESFAFVSSPPEALATWTRLLDAFDAFQGVKDQESGVTELPSSRARFEVRGARGAEPWFEVTLPACTTDDDDDDDLVGDVHVHVHDTEDEDEDATATVNVTINVKSSGHLDHATQAWWQTQIRARINEVTAATTTMGDSQDGYPVYELVTELLALLQSQSQARLPCSSETSVPTSSSSTPTPQPKPQPHSTLTSTPTPAPTPAPTPYHALLTSHHLISPTKRRALAALANALTTGFAKLGYPGIIYAQGTRDAVEAFVREVKRWQWLALRVRCVEPMTTVPVPSTGSPPERWIEMTKVGEVVDWMRKRGMESLVTDLGIGAPSKASKS